MKAIASDRIETQAGPTVKYGKFPNYAAATEKISTEKNHSFVRPDPAIEYRPGTSDAAIEVNIGILLT